jgi:hypothetical protein
MRSFKYGWIGCLLAVFVCFPLALYVHSEVGTDPLTGKHPSPPSDDTRPRQVVEPVVLDPNEVEPVVLGREWYTVAEASPPVIAANAADPADERLESFQLERENLLAVLALITGLALLGAFLCIIFHYICSRSREGQDRAYHDAVEYWETGDVRPGDSPPSASGNTRRVFGVVRNVDSDSSGGGDFSGMG